MNTFLPAFFALVGTVIGGLITFLTTYHLKKAEWKQDAITREIAKRETLYSDFIGEAGRLLLRSVNHERVDPGDFHHLYALQGRIRMHASGPVIVAAEQLAHGVLHAHDLTGDASESEDSDPRGNRFSEAARKELEELRNSI